jgi:hypothetical protein
MSEWEVAPFPLQLDGFSCHDALTFSQQKNAESTTAMRLFEQTVNAQQKNACIFDDISLLLS